MKEQTQKFLKNVVEKYNQDVLKNMDYQLGIGESGKGSVFGSVFITVVWWPILLKNQIEKLKLDEKYIFRFEKHKQRQIRKEIFKLIDFLKDKVIFYEFVQLTASQVSESMNNLMISFNLNQLIHKGVNKVSKIPFAQGFKVSHVFSKIFEKHEIQFTRISENLKQYTQIIKQIRVESKSDGISNVVSFANLIARALNQETLDQWKFNEQMYFEGKFGSGGPSDQVTKKWLQQNKHYVFGYPNIVRFSWNNTIRALENILIMNVNQNSQNNQILKGINVGIQNKSERQRDLWDIILPIKK